MIQEREIQYETAEGVTALKIEPHHFTIDPSCIDADLCTIAALMLEYGSVEAYLRLDVESREAGLQKYEGELDVKIRDEGITKLTEGRIEAMVNSDTKRSALIADLGKAKLNLNIVRWATKALDGKRDCLIAMAYRENQLIKSERYSERR